MLVVELDAPCGGRVHEAEAPICNLFGQSSQGQYEKERWRQGENHGSRAGSLFR